jgi:hypothetical protein
MGGIQCHLLPGVQKSVLGYVNKGINLMHTYTVAVHEVMGALIVLGAKF